MHSLIMPKTGYYEWKKNSIKAQPLPKPEPVFAPPQLRVEDPSRGRQASAGKNKRVGGRNAEGNNDVEDMLLGSKESAEHYMDDRHSTDLTSSDTFNLQINKRMPEKVTCPYCHKAMMTTI